MSQLRVLLGVLGLAVATPAGAHRLDEYLQATTIAVQQGRAVVELRLTPGVEVFPGVFADIDRDADRVVSTDEQRAYAQRVRGELMLSIDGAHLPLRLVSVTFADERLLQEGLGAIELRLEADVPRRSTPRRLTFENRHQRGIGVYLVNALVPRESAIRLGAQERSDDQSFYQLDYTDATVPLGRAALGALPAHWNWIDGALLALIAGIVVAGRRVARQSPNKSTE